MRSCEKVLHSGMKIFCIPLKDPEHDKQGEKAACKERVQKMENGKDFEKRARNRAVG